MTISEITIKRNIFNRFKFSQARDLKRFNRRFKSGRDFINLRVEIDNKINFEIEKLNKLLDLE